MMSSGLSWLLLENFAAERLRHRTGCVSRMWMLDTTRVFLSVCNKTQDISASAALILMIVFSTRGARIPYLLAVSGHFDCQIPNSIISHDKYPIGYLFRKWNNTWRYAKEEEKTPTFCWNGSSRSAPGWCRRVLLSRAAVRCAALRDKNCLCKWNLLPLSKFYFWRGQW